MNDEKYWVDVGNSWWDQPQWFKNFYDYCEQLADGAAWHPYTVLNDELKPYGGKYKHRNTSSSIQFDNESSYLMFLLRWS